MTTTTEARTRRRLANHLRYCDRKATEGGCLTCEAARLVATLPDAVPTQDVRPVLEDMLATAERAARELDTVIGHCDAENGTAMRDALRSVAVTTDSGALTAILARAACTPDAAEAALAEAQERLDRFRVLHAALVNEHQNSQSWLGRLAISNFRAGIIRRIAQAWHGHLPADPFYPLHHNK